MKPMTIVAIILAVTISLNLAGDANAGLWTDFKEGFKIFYNKFKKDSAKAGKDIGRDARKAGDEFKRDAKKMGDEISSGAKSATEEMTNAFKKAKEKLK